MCLNEKLRFSIKVKSRSCELFVLKKNDFLRLSVNFKEFIESFLQKSLMIYLKYNEERKKLIAEEEAMMDKIHKKSKPKAEKNDEKSKVSAENTSEDGKSMKAIPGKAYLAIPSDEPVSLSKSIVIGDSETTSIIGAKAERVNQGDIYNLAGQRVNRLTKGVNILGNKKVLVK